jgi:hypothetical protein
VFFEVKCPIFDIAKHCINPAFERLRTTDAGDRAPYLELCKLSIKSPKQTTKWPAKQRRKSINRQPGGQLVGHPRKGRKTDTVRQPGRRRRKRSGSVCRSKSLGMADLRSRICN